MGMDHEELDHRRQFQAAVSVIQGLPKNGSYRPSYEEMLRFYSYYKQATVGCCNIPRPGFWDPIGRYKWDAWNGLGAMTKEDAMAAYITEMKRVAQKVIDTIAVEDTSEEMFKYFEPLYEVIRDMPRPPESFFQKTSETIQTEIRDHPVQSEYVRSEEERNGTVVTQQEEMEQDIGSKITLLETLTFSTTGLCEEDPEAALGQYTLGLEENLQKDLEAEESLVTISQVSTPTPEDRLGEGAECSQVTSDSESEVFCDSLEQLELSQNQLLINSYNSQCSANSGPRYEAESLAGSHLKMKARRDRLAEEGWSIHSEMDSVFLHPADVREAQASRPGERLIRKNDSSKMDRMRAVIDEMKDHPELTAQVTATVRALQDDLHNISMRLARLEALITSQAQLPNGSSLQSHNPPMIEKMSWWPPAVSHRAFVFLLIWPFFVHWLMKKFQRQKR